MLYTITSIIITLIFGIAMLIAIHTFFYTIYVVFFKERFFTENMTIKRAIKRIRYRIRKAKYIKIVDFIKWVLIDIFSGKDRSKLYGIWAFQGYFGQGKTLGMVMFALQMQEKYKHKDIKICTNFNMKNQYRKITCWQDLMNLPPNTIVLLDEIQSTFTSQKFKEFPIDLLWKITQCRKQGLMVLYSSPVFSRMSIQLRENTDFVITCSNVLGLDRWFSYNFYHCPDFEKYQESTVQLQLRKKMHISFIASNYDYRKYDTNEIVDRWDIEGNDTNEIRKIDNNVVKRLEKYQKVAEKK